MFHGLLISPHYSLRLTNNLTLRNTWKGSSGSFQAGDSDTYLTQRNMTSQQRELQHSWLINSATKGRCKCKCTSLYLPHYCALLFFRNHKYSLVVFIPHRPNILFASQVKLKLLFLHLLFCVLCWYSVTVMNTCQPACLGVEIGGHKTRSHTHQIGRGDRGGRGGRGERGLDKKIPRHSGGARPLGNNHIDLSVSTTVEN